MKRRLFRPRTGLLFIPAVLLVGWALYPPEYAVMATHSSVTHDPPPLAEFPWFIHGNDDLAADSFLGSVSGSNNFVAIRTDGVERMRIHESTAAQAMTGLVEIRTNLTLNPAAGFHGDLNMYGGQWLGFDFSGGGANNGNLTMDLGHFAVKVGDVDVDAGDLNMAFGQWKGASGSFDQGDLLMADGNLEIGPYPTNYRPSQSGNLLISHGQYLHGTDTAPVTPPHGDPVIRVDGFGDFAKNGLYSNHLVLFKSHAKFDNDTPDGLAIQLDNFGATNLTGPENSFVTFFNGFGTPVGRIVGVNPDDTMQGQGVSIESGAADFAECLEKLDPAANFETGEIVGIYGGRVSKQTEGADHVMVITGSPVVLANAPLEERRHLFADVAFLGQVPVRVRGAVAAGDYIVPSGFGDGTGVAIAPGDLTVADLSQIVGKAWTGTQPAQNRRGRVTNGLSGTVNVAIGLKSTDQQAMVDAFNRQLAATLRRLNALARRVAELEGGN